MARKQKSDGRAQDDEARLDQLGTDPREVGPESAGQSASTGELSITEDQDNESVDELGETSQAIEAARLEGIEDAADHPERPVHTHNDYHQRPDDVPPAKTQERKKAS
jgi:hypothetical protein